MMRIPLLLCITCLSFLSCVTNNSKPVANDAYLLSFADTNTEKYGYKDQNGEVIIVPGKYSMCFTDTFRTYAIVLKNDSGYVAIDRHENILYKVFPFDNGPDYASDSLFRITENNKIGYADAITGRIMIKPIFDCAYPFENGIARVSLHCNARPAGEHQAWMSTEWFFINKSGKVVSKVQ